MNHNDHKYQMPDKLKTIALSVFAAVLLSGIQFVVALKSSMKILWQVYIMQNLVGSGPILGYDANGQPMYEGTPVHMFAAYLGLFIGVILYTIIFYFLFSHRSARKEEI